MRIAAYFALLTVLFLFLTGFGLAEQEGDNLSTNENIWNGTWECPVHIFLIEQNSSVITGRYDSKNPEMFDTGVLEGTVSEDGKTYSGEWIEFGTFDYTLSEDNMSYSGTVTTSTQRINQVDFVHMSDLTNATRVGEVADPDNLWTGDWASVRKTHNYVQNGTIVSGTNQILPGVKDQPGVLEGSVSEDGRTITGTWIETGNFNFTISDDGSSFNGTFSVSLDPEADAMSMTALRM